MIAMQDKIVRTLEAFLAVKPHVIETDQNKAPPRPPRQNKSDRQCNECSRFLPGVYQTTTHRPLFNRQHFSLFNKRER